MEPGDEVPDRDADIVIAICRGALTYMRRAVEDGIDGDLVLAGTHWACTLAASRLGGKERMVEWLRTTADELEAGMLKAIEVPPIRKPN